MHVDSRAGRFFRGAADGTSGALSCSRPSTANTALPHASTKLDRTSRRGLSLQAAAKGSRASSSVTIDPQNLVRGKDERQRQDTVISITEGKICQSDEKQKGRKENQVETSLDINNGTLARCCQNEKDSRPEHEFYTCGFFFYPLHHCTSWSTNITANV